MADIVIRGITIPKSNEGPYIMWVYPDGKTVVYSYVVNGESFGTDSQKVVETNAVPLPEGYGRLIDADAFHSPEDLNNAPTILEAEGGGEDGN